MGQMQRKHDAPECNPFFPYHCILLACLCLVDVILNSSVEFGDLARQEITTTNDATVLVIVQVLLQVFGFINFFALFGATFLFRSGLFTLLYRQFRPLLWIHPAYILVTIVLGIVRVGKISQGATLLEVWDDGGYAFFSCVHKLGAVGYYFSSVDAAEKLKDPKFYSQSYWVHR